MTGKRITPPTREERRVRRCRRAVIRAFTVVTVLAVVLLAGYMWGGGRHDLQDVPRLRGES